MAALKTPLFGHVCAAERFSAVYEPAEDTFLLVDALEKDFENILSIRPTIVVEIGSGSGVVSASLAAVLKNISYFITTDINLRASEATVQTAFANSVHLEAVVTDLVSCFIPRLLNAVDILIFNPPYVVTPNDEVGTNDLSASWAGGENGRVVMNRIFPLVSQLLSKSGLFYLVIIRENDQGDIERLLLEQGLKSEMVLSRKTGMEFLVVLKFSRLNSV